MEDTRPRVTLKNATYDKECVVVLDRVGLLIQPTGGPCWCLSWEKLEELKGEDDEYSDENIKEWLEEDKLENLNPKLVEWLRQELVKEE